MSEHYYIFTDTLLLHQSYQMITLQRVMSIDDILYTLSNNGVAYTHSTIVVNGDTYHQLSPNVQVQYYFIDTKDNFFGDSEGSRTYVDTYTHLEVSSTCPIRQQLPYARMIS